MNRMMKSVAVMLCAAFGFAAAVAEPACVVSPHAVALVSDSGNDIIGAGKFEDIFPLENSGLYLCGEAGAYFICDSDGIFINDKPVSMAQAAGDAIIFRMDGLYGAMDKSGDMIVEPKWTQLVSAGEGGWLALNDYPMDNVADEIVYIAAGGEITYTGNHTVGTLKGLREGRMPITTSSGRYGYVNDRGEIASEAKWLYAGEFENGIAVVSDENGYGLVDTQGNAVMETGNRLIMRGEGIIAVLTGKDGLFVYTDDMRRQLSCIETGNASVSVIGKYIVLADESSARVFTCEGDIIYSGPADASFAEGVNGQIIVSDGEWGEACQWLMAPDGSAISSGYQRILPLSDGRYAFLTMQGASYYSDVLGGIQKSWDYESIRYGMIDSAGKEILPAEYLEIRGLGGNRFLLVKEWESLLSDGEGNIIRMWSVPEEERSIDPEYDAGFD